MQENAEKKSRWRRLTWIGLWLVGGYFFGKWLAISGFELWPDLRVSSNLSVIMAMAVSAIYLLMAVLVGIGLISPKIGVAMEMFQDADEWHEEKSMMVPSFVGTVPFALILPIMALSNPLDVIEQTLGLSIIAICIVVGIWACIVMWREMDELWQEISRAVGNLGFYLLSAIGGLWTILAHFGWLPALSTLDWITLIYAIALIATIWVVSRRGLLAEAA